MSDEIDALERDVEDRREIDNELARLSYAITDLQRLLVITWIADNKTRQQVEAFCDALPIDGIAREAVLAMFDARQPKPSAIKTVREATGIGLLDAKAIVRMFVGDVTRAIEFVLSKRK